MTRAARGTAASAGRTAHAPHDAVHAVRAVRAVRAVQCVQCDTVSEAQCGNGKPHSRTAEACIHRVDGLTWLHKCPLIDLQKDVQKDVQSKVQQHSSTFIYMIEHLAALTV